MAASRPFPFTEVGFTRTFSGTVDQAELQWHWDEQDRLVTCAHKTDWKIQYNDKLPELFKEGVSFFIKAGEFHRLIKGTGSLTVRIIQL